VKEAFVRTKEELLGDTIHSMYEIISFSKGDRPDWMGMKDIFLPKANLMLITPEGIEYFDVTRFRFMAQWMLDMGICIDFLEYETARRAHYFGALAHVLSIYETTHNQNSFGFLGRGVNSIQLVWSGGSWRVLNLAFYGMRKKTRILSTSTKAFASEAVHN
jgi:hypothetical protein